MDSSQPPSSRRLYPARAAHRALDTLAWTLGALALLGGALLAGAALFSR